MEIGKNPGKPGTDLWNFRLDFYKRKRFGNWCPYHQRKYRQNRFCGRVFRVDSCQYTSYPPLIESVNFRMRKKK